MEGQCLLLHECIILKVIVPVQTGELTLLNSVCALAPQLPSFLLTWKLRIHSLGSSFSRSSNKAACFTKTVAHRS
jgi:hypothetical protein